MSECSSKSKLPFRNEVYIKINEGKLPKILLYEDKSREWLVKKYMECYYNKYNNTPTNYYIFKECIKLSDKELYKKIGRDIY